jgi:hypothetical protein
MPSALNQATKSPGSQWVNSGRGSAGQGSHRRVKCTCQVMLVDLDTALDPTKLRQARPFVASVIRPIPL